MMPVLFSFGPFHIYSFGLLVASGIVVSLALMEHSARRDGFPPNVRDVFDLAFVAVAAGFIGARAFYVIQEFAWYQGHPLEALAVWQGGLIFYGGVPTVLVSLVVFMKRRGIPFLRGLDFLLPYGVLTHAFGRIGCFLNGCCYGKECHLPWAVPLSGSPGVSVHPSQLYEAAFNFAIFFLLRRRYRSQRFPGEILCLYFLIYPIGRGLLEMTRDGMTAWGPLTSNQWTSAGIFLLAALCYGFLSRAEKNRRTRAGGDLT
ncbi:MAG: prolipoprotein diacylglyceryl transferase [Candidatus Omnitrophota bacterium]